MIRLPFPCPAITDGVRTGDFAVTDPAETSRAPLGMCQSIATWYRDDKPLPPVKLAERYIDIASRP